MGRCEGETERGEGKKGARESEGEKKRRRERREANDKEGGRDGMR